MTTKICAMIWRERRFPDCLLKNFRVICRDQVICRDNDNRCTAFDAGVSLITTLLLGGIEDTLYQTHGATVRLPGRAAR